MWGFFGWKGQRVHVGQGVGNMSTGVGGSTLDYWGMSPQPQNFSIEEWDPLLRNDMFDTTQVHPDFPASGYYKPIRFFKWIDDRVLLVRQYRYATAGYLLEIPAGKLDDGEEPASCAARETEEETGFRPDRLEPLGWIWTTPGFTDEKIWLYLARELRPSTQRLESHEVLTVERIPFDRNFLNRAKRHFGRVHNNQDPAAGFYRQSPFGLLLFIHDAVDSFPFHRGLETQTV